MLRFSLIRTFPAKWYLQVPHRPPSRSVVKDSKYYLELAKERGIRLPGGFKWGQKPLLPGERRVKELDEQILLWGGLFCLFLFYFLAHIKPKTSWEVEVEKKAIERYESLLLEAGWEDLTIEDEY